MSGRPCLPESDKSILDQDAEIMLAFSLFASAKAEFDDVVKQREAQFDKARSQMPNNMVGFS